MQSLNVSSIHNNVADDLKYVPCKHLVDSYLSTLPNFGLYQRKEDPKLVDQGQPSNLSSQRMSTEAAPLKSQASRIRRQKLKNYCDITRGLQGMLSSDFSQLNRNGKFTFTCLSEHNTSQMSGPSGLDCKYAPQPSPPAHMAVWLNE